MLKNYLTVGLRNLRRQKVYSFINIAGLAVGLASCILILLFVRDELSYDRHFPNADRLYRVILDGKLADRTIHAAITPPAMAAGIASEVPEVEAATRLYSIGDPVPVRYEDRQYVENRFYYADSNFLNLFGVKLLQGDPRTALAEPNTVVLTKTTADRYFPSGGATGKTLQVAGQDYRVTGVAQDLPPNQHFHFDFLAAMKGWPVAENPSWVSSQFNTYVLLRPGASPDHIRTAIGAMMRKYAGPQIQQFMNQSMEAFLTAGNRLDYYLQPVADIHLRSDLEFEAEAGSDIVYVYIFLVAAVLILLIACTNFMNLATARSATRAREVGLRKVFGSERRQLVRQFLIESIATSYFALGLAVALALPALPLLNQLAGKQIGYSQVGDPVFLGSLLVLGLIVGLLAGSYPAFFLSAFQPIGIIKGNFSTSTRGIWLRRGLVVFQFAISIALIVSTFVVYNQLTYMRHRALGWNKEHVVVIERADVLGERFQAFQDELRKQSAVVRVGASSSLPGGNFNLQGIKGEGFAAGQNFLMTQMWIDFDWIETMGIEIAAGRAFSRHFTSDSAGFLVNETAVRTLGWTDQQALGKQMALLGINNGEDETGRVVGVMKDWHFMSLHRPLDAMILSFSDDPLSFLLVRIRPQDIPATIGALEQAWHRFVPDQPFQYSFLDKGFDVQYRAEQRLGSIFGLFSVFAVLIACLGLFGLASYTAGQRTKEIGIRKVLGASSLGLLALLSTEFLRMVLVAFILAAPVAYLALRHWLDGFAYRIELGPGVFLLAGVLALFVALATVATQAIRAALSDPVKSLRYE